MSIVGDHAYLSRTGDPAPKPDLARDSQNPGTGPQMQVTFLPVEVAPPPQAIPFNPATYIALPALGATATILDVLVPDGMSAIVKFLGNNFVGGGFVDGTGDLVWQVTVDDVAARNFENIIASLGNPADPSDIGFVRAKQKQHIRLTVKNVGVNITAGQLCGGRFTGWFYPDQYDPPDAWY